MSVNYKADRVCLLCKTSGFRGMLSEDLGIKAYWKVHRVLGGINTDCLASSSQAVVVGSAAEPWRW